METLERVQDWWQRLAMSARPVCLDGDDVRVIAAESANALAAARAENEKLREALAHYANAVNWMSHTDADAMLRVWIGSGDGPDYARRALAAQEGTR